MGDIDQNGRFQGLSVIISVEDLLGWLFLILQWAWVTLFGWMTYLHRKTTTNTGDISILKAFEALRAEQRAELLTLIESQGKRFEARLTEQHTLFIAEVRASNERLQSIEESLRKGSGRR